ncbi:MAG TPA: multicopper oxidase family protein [Pyrinomonadaceae bacterium]|nr:multicopper oxidase family protein [Pyrinomonadaceae bacterium]
MSNRSAKHNKASSKGCDEKCLEVDLSRRAIIIGGAGLTLASIIAGCGGGNQITQSPNRNIGVDGRDYGVLPPQGPAREFSIEARPTEVEIAPGRRASAWTYDGRLPGAEIRVREGERVRVTLRNGLPQDTSIHWHGLHQRGTNNMDGVPGVTQEPIRPGQTFVYDFRAEPAGTFLFHPHSGLQLDRGLYAPLIVEPKRETLSYDREYTLVLDDWLDGSPDEAYGKLKRGEAQHGAAGGKAAGEMGEMPGMKTEGASGGGRAGVGSVAAQMEEGADVAYSTFLINGRAPGAAPEFEVRRNERVRLRLINPSGSTIFRFAVGGHRMTVTHADGFAVEPVEVDALEIASGERYDVLLTTDNPGAWPIAAVSTDEPTRGARAVLRYADSSVASPPPLHVLPEKLKGMLLRYDQLVAAEGTGRADKPERRIDLKLGGQMMPYEWTINGQLYPQAAPLELRAGERVRVSMVNESAMRHPMHLHGHSFRLLSGGNQGASAPPLKDTAFVEANGGRLDFEFLADNPGDWFFHCHHSYHLEAGMARVFKYV